MSEQQKSADSKLVTGWLETALDAISADGDEELAGLVVRLRPPAYADEPPAIQHPTSPERGLLIRLYGPREVVEAFDEDMVIDLRNRFRAVTPGVLIEDVVLDVDPESPDWTRNDGLIGTEE